MNLIPDIIVPSPNTVLTPSTDVEFKRAVKMHLETLYENYNSLLIGLVSGNLLTKKYENDIGVSEEVQTILGASFTPEITTKPLFAMAFEEDGGIATVLDIIQGWHINADNIHWDIDLAPIAEEYIAVTITVI